MNIDAAPTFTSSNQDKQQYWPPFLPSAQSEKEQLSLESLCFQIAPDFLLFLFIKNAALTNQVKPLSPFIWINYFIDGTKRFPNACRNAVLQWVTAHSLCYNTSFLLCCSSCLLQNPWKEVIMHCCLDWTWMTVTQTLYIHTEGPTFCVCPTVSCNFGVQTRNSHLRKK